MNEIINGNGLGFILFVAGGIVVVLGWCWTLGVNAMGRQSTNWHAENWARSHPHRD